LKKEQLKPDAIKLHNAADVVAYLKGAMNMVNVAYPKAKGWSTNIIENW
jgi:hypothetical protein